MARPLNLKSRSKYGARWTTYAGHSYHSKAEADYAARLTLLRTAVDPHLRVLDWEPQVRIPLDVAGVHVCDYVVDFRITFADARVEYHEVKGYWTDTARLKVKLFRALYPERTLVIVKKPPC